MLPLHLLYLTTGFYMRNIEFLFQYHKSGNNYKLIVRPGVTGGDMSVFTMIVVCVSSLLGNFYSH